MITEGYFLSVLHKNILYCGYSLESPWRGDSNEQHQHTFALHLQILTYVFMEK